MKCSKRFPRSFLVSGSYSVKYAFSHQGILVILIPFFLIWFVIFSVFFSLKLFILKDFRCGVSRICSNFSYSFWFSLNISKYLSLKIGLIWSFNGIPRSLFFLFVVFWFWFLFLNFLFFPIFIFLFVFSIFNG